MISLPSAPVSDPITRIKKKYKIKYVPKAGCGAAAEGAAVVDAKVKFANGFAGLAGSSMDDWEDGVEEGVEDAPRVAKGEGRLAPSSLKLDSVYPVV
jgi:hypothetical protein